ncbi:MAG TPA: SLBB domain-containing protein [Terriglobales bacterium]|nr:SLBB domain-containing protein [Terriglobales bacterium]
MSWLLLCAVPAISQNPAANSYSYGAGTQRQSRAAVDAEMRVSLPADKIIDILSKEPGLMLEVKKLLVRKAYEQGRILDPTDLTDESVYVLLRDNENARLLATHEIVDRAYIRAKPSKEELARETYLGQQQLRSADTSQLAAAKNPSASQEELYWAQREQAQRTYPPQTVNPPANVGPQPTPDNAAPQNPARAVQRASATAPPDYTAYDGIGFEAARYAGIKPEELGNILDVSSPPSRTGSGSSSNGSGATSQLPGSEPAATNPGLGGILPEPPPDNFAGQNQQASLQQSQRPLSMRQPVEQPTFRHQPNPYANVPSLYDLYQQVSRRSTTLERFGESVFANGNSNMQELPMDLPVGPDYVLGPGDGLSIELWGGVSQRLQRTVDREGRVALPEVGTVLVAGRTLGDVQNLVQSVLRTQFRELQADVSLARLRTVRVYVVGDVQNPGAYDVSSLSTPLNALYVAGGPTSRGSLRTLKHYRGKQLVEDIDVYDLLLHGVRSDMQRIQPGDTILVPPLGPQVVVDGMVRRPAIYELNDEKDLAAVLELAGGVLSSGTLRHVDVERVMAHQSRTMLRLDIPETNDQAAVTKTLNEFQIQDGDKIKISPILPYADKTVFLDGHVFRPGKYAYRDGMKVSDLIHSYNDLLPEPSERHAEVIRLEGPSYKPTVLTFNLADAMSGKEQDLELKPFDTVRIFGRYDFEDQPMVTVSGEVRDPGDHVTNGVTHLRDAIFLAGGLSPDADSSSAQVFRHTSDGKMRVISVDLKKALAGDATEDILLDPKDRLFIHRDQAKADPAVVTIEGEVARPGKYPLGEGMTSADLVRLSGGFRRSADTETADLTTYESQEGRKLVAEHRTVEIAKAMSGAADTDVRLHAGDVLSIRQVAGWKDIGASIKVEGEVVHPGTYGIQEGERLSSVLARAGGFRGSAYAYGAILERAQVRELEEGTRADLIRNIRAEGASFGADADADPLKAASAAQWQAALHRLETTPPAGRMIIHISENVKKWQNTPSDIELRAGDTLIIPKRPNFVMVDGAVYNPTAVTFHAGKSAGWYLTQGGGPTQAANKKGIFVIRANGSVVGTQGGLFNGSVLSTELRPGDMIVVPEKSYGGSAKWKNLLQTSQLVSSIGIAIQVARGF